MVDPGQIFSAAVAACKHGDFAAGSALTQPFV